MRTADTKSLPSAAPRRLAAALALSLTLASAPAAASPFGASPGVAGAPSLGARPAVDPKRPVAPAPLGGAALPPFTITMPDLVVVRVDRAGELVNTGRWVIVPLRIVVANRGRAASRSEVALRAFGGDPSRRTYVALNDDRDPSPDEVLFLPGIAGGLEVVVTTFLVVRGPLAGGPHVVFVEIDPKEIPTIYDLYDATDEWDETNNVSAAFPIFD